MDSNFTVNSFDANLVLQFSAMLVGPLDCGELGDLNGDCLLDSVDAALILQLAAGMIPILLYEPCEQ